MARGVALPPAQPPQGAGRLAQFRRGQFVYFAHVRGLLAPGEEIAVFAAHQLEPRSLEKWDDNDLEQMVEEGRRQLDRQLSVLAEIRGRAQWLFTVGSAVTAPLAGAFVATRPTGALIALWLVSLLILLYGVAGAAAVLTVRADFRAIDTAKLSQVAPPVLRALATSYSSMLATGENTVATRLTVFRQAVVFVLVGGYLGLIGVLIHA
jgi:hypothetical protein